MNKVRFNEKTKDPNDLVKQLDEKYKQDYGYYLLRSNYKRVKSHSKYTQEGARSRSPNVSYSYLNDETLKNNPQYPQSIFQQTTVKDEKENKPFFIKEHSDTINEHLLRGFSASQPYCYITKEPYKNFLSSEYTHSGHGAYPSWGFYQSGYRTRSHFVAEPADRFVNIDMYKRPLTNQTGKIIFDYGRPNNGYYLQRNQYDNTWFNSSLKLNKTDVLKSINPKTKMEYKNILDSEKINRAKTADGSLCSEYTERYAINGKKL